MNELAERPPTVSQTADEREIVAIIVNYRTPELIGRCLASLQGERAHWPGLRAVVVDGGSGDGSAAAISRTIAHMAVSDWVTFQPLELNGGFGYANNQAMLTLEEQGRLPEAILLLNPDAAILPGAVGAMIALMDGGPRIAAVGAQLQNEKGRPGRSAFVFPGVLENFLQGTRTEALRRLVGRRAPVEGESARPADWTTGAALLLRRAALADVGLFNDNFFLYFEETELCHRLWRAGWEIWTEPRARVVHLGARATKLFDPEDGQLINNRLPGYYYQSWRLFSVLTRGRLYALLAALAWTLGHSLWRLRCLLTRRSPDQPPMLVRDFWRVGLGPPRREVATPPRLGDPAGAAPGWTARVPD